MRTIAEVTEPTVTGNPSAETGETKTGGAGTIEPTTQEVTPTPEETTSKKDEEIAELKKQLEQEQKAVKGFQPALTRANVERDKALRSLAAIRDQSALGDEVDPVVAAEVQQARERAFSASARAKATELVMGRNLPETLRKSIAGNPLAFIKVSEGTDETTVEFEVEEKLPTYLDSLEKELGEKNKPAPTVETLKEKEPPVPSGGQPTPSNVIYSDQIDQNTEEGRAKYQELRTKILSGEIEVRSR